MRRLAVLPFLVGAALRLLVVGYVQVLHGNFLFLDDQGYDRIGWSLAQAWHMGIFPSPESVGYTGTVSYLYYVLVAAVYYVAGHHWLVVKLLGALLSALCVPAAAAIGYSLSGRRLAVAAAWLAALYPSAVFWGATGLKDGPMAALLLAMAALALRPLTTARLIAMTVLISVGLLTRPVAGVIGLLMLVAPIAEIVLPRRVAHRSAASRMVVLVGALGLAVVTAALGARYLPVVKASLAGESALTLGTGPVTVSFGPSPASVVRAMLGPFPWSYGPGADTVFRALYPGMIVWIVMLPTVAVGCWAILRSGSWAARGVVASACAFLYLYSSVFQDQGFFRQRFTVEILLLVLGLYALDRMPRVTAMWMAAGVSALVPVAMVQAGALPPAGGVAAVVVLAWVAFGGRRLPVAVRRHRFTRRVPRRLAAGPPGRGSGSSRAGSAPGDAREVDSALSRAMSTGVRVMGLRVSGYAVGFVASVLIARALGPDGRGRYAYPVALLGIVMALAHLGLEFAQIHLAGRGSDLRRMWANATVFSVAVGVACWGAVAAASMVDPRIVGGLPLSWIAVPLAQLPLLLMSLYWASLLQLDGRLKVATWASWLGVAAQAIAVGVLFLMHILTPFRVLALQWLTNGSTWLLMLLASHRVGLVSFRIDGRLLRRSVIFGAKSYVALIFFFLVLRVDQLLVRGYLGYRQLGMYALATTVAELLWLLTDPLSAALIPHQVRAGPGQDRRMGFAMARLSLWVSAGAVVVGWLVAPVAIPFAYGSGFAGAVPAVRLLLPGVAILGAARPLGAALVKEGKAVLLSAVGLGALGLNVVLNVALLPRFGIVGASVASSVCYVALALAYLTATLRRDVAGWRDLAPRASDLRLLGSGLRRRSAARSPGPLRVTFIVGKLDRGGTERQIIILGSELVARGHNVTVVCLGGEGAQAGIARAAGMSVVAARFPGLQRSVILNPWPWIRRFRAILKEAAPDVVHCFLYSSCLIGVPAARSIGVPVVVGSRRSLATAFAPPRVTVPWGRICDRLCNAVVCNSRVVLEDAVANDRLPRAKAVVIRNGVQLPTKVSPSARSSHILVIANLIAYKGHAVALDAFAQVCALLPAIPARLQLAGSGPEEGQLRAQAHLLGIDHEVDFLGSVTDIPALLAKCAFTVLPSLSEGMPNAVLESLAHGRAVVASAVGGVPEILAEGGGILVPPGSAEELAAAMCTLLTDPEWAAHLGAEGRALVRRSFGVGQLVTESLQLYEGLLSRKRPRKANGAALDRTAPPVAHSVPVTVLSSPATEPSARRRRRH